MQIRFDNISRSNLIYIESIYAQYQQDPRSVEPQWQEYFSTMETDGTDISNLAAQQKVIDYAKAGSYKFTQTTANNLTSNDAAVAQLINAYRSLGHTGAQLDPLHLASTISADELQPQKYGLSSADLAKEFTTDIACLKNKPTSLKLIISTLEQVYCSNIGIEYAHLSSNVKKQWLQQRLEQHSGIAPLDAATKKHILSKLTAAEGFEKYLHTAFPGAKRFGLEGGESLIPLLDSIIEHAPTYKSKHVILGMAHRGRLNSLVNIFGKLPQDLFNEFAGKKEVTYGSGDVKYHFGYSSTLATKNGDIDATMLCNPSHLAIASPVVEGVARALQDQNQNSNHSLPLVIHGDAAVAAQGVIMETLQLSQTRGYATGGTIHIVVNNQVGFTTHEPQDVRSSSHCTDVAKIINAPVIHVNGDNVDAVVYVAQLALAYRMEFKEDIFIDLVCYRRLGHNEADDPTITQPMMYKKVKQHKTTRNIYAAQLIEQNILTQEQDKQAQTAYRELLKQGDRHVPAVVDVLSEPEQKTTKYAQITAKEIKQLIPALTQLPQNFVAQKQVAKVISDRQKMLTGEAAIDWGCAENLSYASLLQQDIAVRITGQDVARGTFSHRHAVLFDQETGQDYTPLKTLATDQYQFNLFNSLLSEEAVVAFEYGYAKTRANNLTVWEAQFGDFANVAQVVIDQFIASAATKWNQHSNLVMLLPHGYEGQGPEHSSARLERFLQLCGEDNMRVCMPTSAAQIFHLLRDQALSNTNKPLIVMSPKSLLRHKGAACSLADLTDSSFQTILTNKVSDAKKIERVILSSGKIYYDLIEAIDTKTAVIRVEQLYPFPIEQISKLLQSYPKLKKLVWCQDEPQNQGSWQFARSYLDAILVKLKEVDLIYAGRDSAASPAAGYMKLHLEQQKKLLDVAVRGDSK
jgi:2-oxoglutarate dehydrogenase E1 component